MLRSRFLKCSFCVLAVLALCPAPAAPAADETLTIEPREKWSNVFGNTEAEFHYLIKARQAFTGRAGWTFSINQRTIARGEANLAIDPNKPGSLDVPLRVPEVKDGVALQATLTVSVFAEGQAKATATHEKTLWLFPRNPWSDREQWLKDLKLTVFDPKGTTTGVLKKMNVPFEEAPNVTALGELKQGMLIVGEGTSFKEQAGLAETLIRVAARGVPVLCLAPTDGVIPVPGSGGNQLPSPASLSWRRRDIISELDKRLDAEAWPADGRVVASSLILKAEEGSVVAEVAAGRDGWHFLQAAFPGGGTLVVCGFGILEKWDAGPAPRFLLDHLLELLRKSASPR